MEFVDGRELFDKIVEKGQYPGFRLSCGGFFYLPCGSEKSAAHVARQLLNVIAYLHERGIAHR
jgi:serine/threonine protein kinase